MDLFAGVAAAGAEESGAASAPSVAASGSRLTGERNENSVLFSLATLAKHVPAGPASAVTESSALIDIRALVAATSRARSSSSRADDIVNLSGGGAFSPLFAPPVTFVPAQEAVGASGRKTRLMVGAIALSVVSLVGAATIAGSHVRSSTSDSITTGAVSGVSVAPPVVAVVSTTMSTGDEPPAPSAQLAAVLPGRASAPATQTTGPVVHPVARGTEARPATTQVAAVPTVPTAGAGPKCCPGENDTACHMRLAVGAACASHSQASPSTLVLPFDRPAAARALGLNVASCKRADGPTGLGHVRVTFQSSGAVSAVDVEAPYASTAVGACVAQRYRGASVPPFSGGSLTVGKSFAIE